MSEWKWCKDCGHSYTAHRPLDKPKFGACTMEGCDCPMMAFDLADF